MLTIDDVQELPGCLMPAWIIIAVKEIKGVVSQQTANIDIDVTIQGGCSSIGLCTARYTRL